MWYFKQQKRSTNILRGTLECIKIKLWQRQIISRGPKKVATSCLRYNSANDSSLHRLTPCFRNNKTSKRDCYNSHFASFKRGCSLFLYTVFSGLKFKKKSLRLKATEHILLNLCQLHPCAWQSDVFAKTSASAIFALNSARWAYLAKTVLVDLPRYT